MTVEDPRIRLRGAREGAAPRMISESVMPEPIGFTESIL
jgi:hypothetical protein